MTWVSFLSLVKRNIPLSVFLARLWCAVIVRTAIIIFKPKVCCKPKAILLVCFRGLVVFSRTIQIRKPRQIRKPDNWQKCAPIFFVRHDVDTRYVVSVSGQLSKGHNRSTRIPTELSMIDVDYKCRIGIWGE